MVCVVPTIFPYIALHDSIFDFYFTKGEKFRTKPRARKLLKSLIAFRLCLYAYVIIR